MRKKQEEGERERTCRAIKENDGGKKKKKKVERERKRGVDGGERRSLVPVTR